MASSAETAREAIFSVLSLARRRYSVSADIHFFRARYAITPEKVSSSGIRARRADSSRLTAQIFQQRKHLRRARPYGWPFPSMSGRR